MLYFPGSSLVNSLWESFIDGSGCTSLKVQIGKNQVVYKREQNRIGYEHSKEEGTDTFFTLSQEARNESYWDSIEN